MAYQLLQHAAAKRTEYLVIEAGVDTEPTFTAELPSELISILQRDLHLVEEVEGAEQVSPPAKSNGCTYSHTII